MANGEIWILKFLNNIPKVLINDLFAWRVTTKGTTFANEVNIKMSKKSVERALQIFTLLRMVMSVYDRMKSRHLKSWTSRVGQPGGPTRPEAHRQHDTWVAEKYTTMYTQLVDYKARLMGATGNLFDIYTRTYSNVNGKS